MNIKANEIHHMDKFIRYVLWRDFKYINKADCDDIVQEVYYYIIRTQKDTTLWYLSQLVRGRAINFLKRRAFYPLPSDDSIGVDTDPYGVDLLIEDISKTLNSTESFIFDRLWVGDTQEEIATKLGTSQQAVSLRIKTMEPKIKKLLPN